MITGKTTCIGILGWPVGHSLSPVMQNSAFAAAGLDCVYVPLPVRPAALPQAVAGLKALGYRGANVTIPHKISIMPLLDELDTSAKMVGAVNTIVIQDNKSRGYNTDAAGFVQPLLKKGVALHSKKAVILGAGGAARAVIWGLMQQGIGEISIGVRNISKAQAIVEAFSDNSKIAVHQWPSTEFNAKLSTCDVLINSTPLGMSPNIEQEPPLNWAILPANIVVYDLIYTPLETSFLQQAGRLGHMTLNGAGMLVEQGAAAFTLWSGIPAPTATMYAALGLNEM
ncbi:shikimate dehydrogenase|uniref:Shikimate dehydrogenase (NADP(+)) n=1 Tax=Dendrosporobacter quercicolus TaxID=146817 RepID=A0A1G9LDR6_9FIRM|nr:shikimate dehydrogenase [Dendrosporobacter quercicolus]NSL46681.1 shikimate dehydrogenase [Dendrosporobacter quercicolus DSM 1736]SDL60102.1 shikimate dehydrogenase [Dendrosporobacter quercicolus]